jgi:hypothetical protein
MANTGNVVPRPGTGAVVGPDGVTLSLPPHSYQMIRVAVAPA